MSMMIQFGSAAGEKLDGYLALPEKDQTARHTPSETAPGVVVVQEWWGLNSQIRDVADRLSLEGYRALVPDLYRGRVTGDADEAQHLMEGLDWSNAARQDIRGALHYLKANGQQAAVLGFCMGGALSIIAGVHVPETDATVCYYGIPPRDVADPAKMQVPFLGHFATDDSWCNPEAVDALDEQIRAAGVPYEIHRYEAQHAFFNNQRPQVYNEEAAKQSWERTLAFLRQHIGPGAESGSPMPAL